MGCRTGAKQSTLITYLQDAAARGARIVENCDVRRVVIDRGAAPGVDARVGNVALTVRAQAVIVAAGSVHSPAVLLRSGIALPALGHHLALHPATAVLAEMEQEVRPWTGTVQAHYSDQFADLDSGYGFKLETARSEEHTSELQSQSNLVCRLLLEKKKKKHTLKAEVLRYQLQSLLVHV